MSNPMFECWLFVVHCGISEAVRVANDEATVWLLARHAEEVGCG